MIKDFSFFVKQTLSQSEFLFQKIFNVKIQTPSSTDNKNRFARKSKSQNYLKCLISSRVQRKLHRSLHPQSSRDMRKIRIMEEVILFWSEEIIQVHCIRQLNFQLLQIPRHNTRHSTDNTRFKLQTTHRTFHSS